MNLPPKKPEAWATNPAPVVGSAALDLQQPDNVTTLRPTGGRELLAQTLLDIRAFVRRFVVLPSDHAEVAVTLWIAHAHAVECFESTPRLAFLSPEPGSGKSRALEVITTLVPSPMHAVNATPAALFRAVSDLEHRPTILFDEIDTVFGPKAKENEEVRGFLNAGHRRGAVAYRCVGMGTAQKVVPFPAYCAVAVAGLNDVPDTIATRSVIIRMRKRSSDEKVLPWRARQREPEGYELRNRLASLLAPLSSELLDAEPAMPEGVEDRPADVWEPLLAIADAAGHEWPDAARTAAVAMTTGSAPEPTFGVLLLSDLRVIWNELGDPQHVPTSVLIEKLVEMPEAPWASIKGNPIDSRRLATLLKRYGVNSTQIRIDSTTCKGYTREQLWDPWSRYCPLLPSPDKGNKRNNETFEPVPSQIPTETVSPVSEEPPSVSDNATPIPSRITDVSDVSHFPGGREEGLPGLHLCLTCDHPLPDFEIEAGNTTHAACN